MKPSLSPLLLPLILLCATPQAFGTDDPLSCADQSVVASAVRTPKDVEIFVQCAYEYVQEMGFEEARRAFNEDERWKSGPTYVFVDEMTPVPGASRAFVFPPDPSREGVPWGELVDIFGSDLILEFVRLMSSFGEGWTYYDFTNPASEKSEPKAAYAKAIDWNGGAGSDRRGDLSARHSGHMQQGRRQRHGARRRSFQREVEGVCTLRRHGA